MKKVSQLIKNFGHNNIFIEADIRRIEKELEVDFGHRGEDEDIRDINAFLQFKEQLRNEAQSMSKHYIIFYCLENSIRDLISSRLKEEYGIEWWKEAVPENVQKSAEKNQEKENKSGVTPRSEELIDYTNFGELGEIIKVQWDIFGDMFRDKIAVERILANLNLLRGPIAHCKPLAEDEISRLHLSLRDWFRQMS